MSRALLLFFPPEEEEAEGSMADHLSLLLDPLYCQEQQWEAEEDDALQMPGDQVQELTAETEAYWAELLSSLAVKEWETHPDLSRDYPAGGDGNPYFCSARRGAVEWVARTTARHGFSALTAVLAVNYLDRSFLAGGGLRLHPDRPWMGRLSAVACLSLAAKVEETHVPLLLDLQLAAAAAEEEEEGESTVGYVFEAKTVRRMELLVLSALGWRMNPATPLSFIHHVLPELVKGKAAAGAAASRLRELLRRCHAILLSVLADWRWVRYPPSVWAGATLLHAMGLTLDPGSSPSSEYYETHHPLALLNLPKERVEGCYQLILESMASGGGGGGGGNKRKHVSSSCNGLCSPPSPNGVIGSCFSCDSGDSRPMWPSSVSSSPVPPPCKRPNCCMASASAGDEEGGEQVGEHEVFA